MLFVVLLLLNFLIIILVKPDYKYWISVILWIFLVSVFITWRIDNDSIITKQEVQYRTGNKTTNEVHTWENLSNLKKHYRQRNFTFTYAVWLQTLLTFVFQITGHKKTKWKLFWWTQMIFLLLLIAVSVLIVMMDIVPAGGIVS